MRLNAFLKDFGLERADVENWTSRIELRTSYQSTVPGRAREFSKLNVLELAMVKALVSAGCKPSRAVVFAEIVLDNYKDRRLKKWLVLPAQAFNSAIEVGDLTPDLMESVKEKSPSRTVIAIDAKAIADRVDQIFESQDR